MLVSQLDQVPGQWPGNEGEGNLSKRLMAIDD